MSGMTGTVYGTIYYRSRLPHTLIAVWCHWLVSVFREQTSKQTASLALSSSGQQWSKLWWRRRLCRSISPFSLMVCAASFRILTPIIMFYLRIRLRQWDLLLNFTMRCSTLLWSHVPFVILLASILTSFLFRRFRLVMILIYLCSSALTYSIE